MRCIDPLRRFHVHPQTCSEFPVAGSRASSSTRTRPGQKWNAAGELLCFAPLCLRGPCISPLLNLASSVELHSESACIGRNDLYDSTRSQHACGPRHERPIGEIIAVLDGIGLAVDGGETDPNIRPNKFQAAKA